MSMLVLDKQKMASSFPREPFGIQHRLAGHPLFSLPALAELAGRMPRDRVEYNSGKLKPNQDPDATPAVDLAPAEVIRQIETAGAWMVLKHVENVPEYRALIESCLAEAAQAAGGKSPAELGMTDFQGFIFVASAQSVTPFHLDYEENIYVHLHGEKFMHVFDNRDRTLVSEENLETFPGKHRNHAYRESFEARSRVFRFEPGEGMFLPYTWPHWVRTGKDYAISMAVTWKSPQNIKLNKLYFANAVLRRIGLPQPAPGRFAAFDAAKVAGVTAARALIEPLRRSEAARRRLRGLVFGKKANYFYGGRKEA
jgi:hypothetical protein